MIPDLDLAQPRWVGINGGDEVCSREMEMGMKRGGGQNKNGSRMKTWYIQQHCSHSSRTHNHLPTYLSRYLASSKRHQHHGEE